MSEQNTKIGTYQACGTMSTGIAGAPSVDFSLLVVTPFGTVSGIVVITQALPMSPRQIHVHVTGRVRPILGAPFTKLVTISGIYFQPCPPPALCIIEERFEAHMLVDDNWDGIGGFEYGPGGHDGRQNCKVKSHKCEPKA